jgi:hypothetical protein
MRRKGLDHRPGQAPPEDIAAEADRDALRLLHATKALEIPTQRWTDTREHDVRFIEDDGLREGFAALIGQLACSHWWPTTKLRTDFDRTIGAPTWCPPGWTVDPLRVACLLRAADAAHVDDRRAPAFLHILRHPSGTADHHWLFQRRMQRATRRGEQLELGSTVAFTAAEAPAWWVAVETLRMIDGELRAIDALLQVTHRPRLAARRVAAVDDLQALQDHIKVAGWQPVDARVRISDIPALIERLGGRRLYGNDPNAPLRELIQNAADAIRARRLLEKRPPDWGSIRVATGQDDHGRWIEVRDDGLGMSEAVLVGPLLDFGVSYWDSDLSCEEFPGLLAAGFRSVGEFGIGFFSVFMWGSKVRVTTRSCRAAHTSVLELEHGLASPPLLRRAADDEHLVDPGTTVRVWLAQQVPEPWLGRRSTLAGRCEHLCPTLDVNVYVQEADAAQPERVITAGDWLTLEPNAFLRRIVGGDSLDSALTNPLADDDPELDRVLAMIEPIVEPSSGEIVGRACLRPPWIRSSVFGSTLVTRGIRLGWRGLTHPLLGVLAGVPSKAARDEGVVSVSPEAIQAWCERQEAKAAAAFEGFARFELAGVLAGAMTKPVTKLPVVWGSQGWTLSELAHHGSLPGVLVLVFPDVLDDTMRTSDDGRRRQPPVDLPEYVFLICGDWPIPLDHPDELNPTLGAILLSIARAWRVPAEELRILGRRPSQSTDGKRGPAESINEVLGAWIHVVCRPGSSRESVGAALEGFFELARKHPSGTRQVGGRMAALGKAISEAQKMKLAQRREK